MFQNLGRMLCEFYFPDEARQVRALMETGRVEGGEESAALQVLGLGFEDLGVGVARVWGLPESLPRCMRKPLGSPMQRAPEQGVERLRWVAMAANEVASTLLASDAASLEARLGQIGTRYSRTLALSPAAISEGTLRARHKLVALAEALDLRVAPGTPAARLLQLPPAAGAGPAQDDALGSHEPRASETQPLPAVLESQASGAVSVAQVNEVLAAGIQDITNAMVESFQLNDVLRMILETMFRALGFRRMVFCLREARTDLLTGRFGLGEGSEAAVRAMKVRLNAPSFLLLPLQIKGQTFALIYADQSTAGGIVVDDKALGLLRTLRNQAVMAFRQAGCRWRGPKGRDNPAMAVVFEKPSLAQRFLPLFRGFDLPLLLAVALFGITKKGATRWINVGIVIQPSEILKIAMPLMLAWWFQKREGTLRPLDFAAAGLLLAVPVGLIMKQPDLGTSLLVLAAGLSVIFFAGLSWKLVLPPVVLGGVGILALVLLGDQLCADGVRWSVLHDYQQQRICTLLDPTRDPLGKGFHIIQGMIAIGSGGMWGKGFMAGTQTHLEFIPERTTDFIFAAFSEEFGLAGNMFLLVCFLMLVWRGLAIAAGATSLFGRLMAGAVSMIFFTYAFVNMGMVSGILPVVGVPLPFISYGGTAMVTLGLALGILMSVARAQKQDPKDARPAL